MQLRGCIQTVTVTATVTCTTGNSVEPLLRSMHHAPASPAKADSLRQKQNMMLGHGHSHLDNSTGFSRLGLLREA